MKRLFIKGLDYTRPVIRFLWGKEFSENRVPTYLLWKHVILQKILRINGHVRWPVDRSSTFKSPQKITRVDTCPGYSVGCYLDGRNGIEIGKNTLLGPGVKMISMNHDLCAYHEFIDDGPIVIGDNCWIASNAVILSGVQLGDHTVVAAGAIVTKSFPEGDLLIGGMPAKVIKKLENYREK